MTLIILGTLVAPRGAAVAVAYALTTVQAAMRAETAIQNPATVSGGR